MKNIFSLFIFILLSSFIHSQTLMPAQTKAAMQVIGKDLHANRAVPSKKVRDFYPIYQYQGQPYIAVLCKVNDSFRKAEAIRDGFEVGAVIGHVASIRIPLSHFNENFAYPGIEYIEMAEKLEPELDRAVVDIRADLVHKGAGLPQPFTGKNVIIGIVDWGFDYTHPTFYDTTLSHSRILATWDQEKVIGTPPPGYDHGAAYLTPEDLAAAQHDTFSILHDYHGTHVAGIAGGSGGGTKYRGVGFESDLLFSQMRTDVSSSLDAFMWMFEMAQAAGKRLVINNSWGGYKSQPLDGTSLLSQAIDALSDMGVVFVFSAGNNGNINFHLKKTFNQDSVRTRIMGFNYGTDDQLWGQTITMWGEEGKPFAAQFRVLSSTNVLLGETALFYTDTAAPFLDTFLLAGTDTVFYNVTIDAAHPMNGRPQITLNVKNENTNLRNILYAEAASGTVHFWNTRLTVYGGGNWGYGFTAPAAGYVLGDKNYGIGHPGVTNSVITAAAHETNYLIAYFSSYGPRMDDVLKPDISAPGLDIISSFNSFAVENPTPDASVDFNGKSYEFIKLSGTSMSAPMITGAVALLLEADPTLSSADVKELVINSARTDASTGSIGPEGNVRWGYGKLDVYAAMQDIFFTGIESYTQAEHYVIPNPAHDRIYISGQMQGNETYRLVSLDGQEKSRGQLKGSVYVGDVPAGMYLLNVESGKKVESFRVVINR